MPTTIDKNHIMWESVRREKDVSKALALAADVGEEAIKSSIVDREAIRTTIAELKKMVAGNGDPTHSIIARLAAVESQLQLSCTALTEIQKLLIGDLKGDEGSISTKIDALNDRLRDVEKTTTNAIKIMWLAIAVVVGQVVLKILGLF